MERGCSYKFKPLNNSLLGEGESVFFKSVDPGKSITLQWEKNIPRINEYHKLNFMGKKKDTKLIREGE